EPLDLNRREPLSPHLTSSPLRKIQQNAPLEEKQIGVENASTCGLEVIPIVNDTESIPLTSQPLNSQIVTFDANDLEFDIRHDKVGHGTFSCVYRSKYQNRDVAVKVFKSKG